MPHRDDPLLTRAADVIARSQKARVESRRLLDFCRLERLQRELAERLREIEQIARRGKQR